MKKSIIIVHAINQIISNSAGLEIVLQIECIKLYDKLPNKLKKLENIQEFKMKLEYFLLKCIFILWINICLTEYYYQLS
jgi:hypothetical protein